MSDRTGTFESLAVELGLALASLEGVLTAGNAGLLLAELGLDNPPGIGGDAGFAQKLNTAAQLAGGFVPDVQALQAASDAGDQPALLAAVAHLVQHIQQFIADLDAVAADLVRASGGSPAAAEIASFATTLVERILGATVVAYLDIERPLLRRILSVLTIVEMQPVTVTVNGVATQVVRRQIHLDRIGRALTDPLGVLRDGYGWGLPTFNEKLLFSNTCDVYDTLEPTAVTHDEDAYGPPDLDLFTFLVRKTTDVSPPGLEGRLFAGLAQNLDLTLSQFSDEFRAALQVEGQFGTGLILRLLPPSQLDVVGQAAAAGTVALRLLGGSQDSSSPFVVFGETGGSALIAKQISAGLVATLRWDAAANKAGSDVQFEAKFTEGKLFVDTAQGDGFLASVLPSGGLSADINLTVRWSSQNGLHIEGAGGLDIELPIGAHLGPVLLSRLHVSVRPADTGLAIDTGLAVSLALGPMTATIDGVGFSTQVTFKRGNLGPVDAGIHFMPPSGVGLVVDLAGLSGGGFLKHDAAKHQYLGVLQLEFAELALQAFGLLSTQIANARGYSLIALVDAEFPPVQLGWGFTLDGVGGLLAINRTISIDALRAALSAGQLGSILFPKNAVTDAARILGQLDTLFPAAEGRFLFGPMAEIGWGTPTVLTASIAIVLEVPEPILLLLLARVALRLPTQDKPLVRINMDALGVLDLSKSTFALDATLFDSRLLSFPLSGDMALRVTWAGQREFLLAIGGFHPRFTPPAGFPALKRITVDMPSGIISKLRLEAYLAVTSNTVQFGANLDVFIGVSGFGLAGHLGFDALLQILPFYFEADISGSVALKAGGDDLMSVTLDATLSGPAPWNISGDFKFSILFWDVHVSFSQSWGDDAPVQQIAAVDVGQLLRTALADRRSWGVQLPPGVPALVAARHIDEPNLLVAHPLAQLEAHETIVPLGLDIARFGAAPPAGARRFAITDVRIGNAPVAHVPVEDDFAPAQFFDLDDEAKLTGPSFERHDSGVRFGEGLVTSGPAVSRTISYETFYLDDVGGDVRTDPGTPVRNFALGELIAILGHGAAGRSMSARPGRERYKAPGRPVSVAEPAFVVVDTTTLAAAGIGPAAGASYSDTRAALDDELARNPERRGLLQVVARHEIGAA